MAASSRGFRSEKAALEKSLPTLRPRRPKGAMKSGAGKNAAEASN